MLERGRKKEVYRRSEVALCSGEVPAAAMEPMPESFVSTVEDRKLEDREKWWKMGLKAISDGKLVVLLLSGGQVFIYFTFFL
uniref:Putative UTP--glucose-1-phosphate uridylyltransferase family n=1 Tax=Helianthus annuus TaxID=4232 RepID=A0A251VK07_HELAN